MWGKHLHACGRCRIPATRRDDWIAKLSRNAARDARNGRRLRRMGWSVLTIWECQLTPNRLARTKARIFAFLAGRQAPRTMVRRPA